MEVCSSNEMGAPNASHLGTGDHAAEPTEANQDQSRKTRFSAPIIEPKKQGDSARAELRTIALRNARLEANR